MAKVRNGGPALIVNDDLERREIISWYKDALTNTPPPLYGRWEPVRIGPTWQWDENGVWVLPEFSGGWDTLAWCGMYLRDLKTGSPWQFTLEQARFILHFQAVTSDGRFDFNSAVLQRLKGWGKDPMAAAFALSMMLGPSIPDGWRDDEPSPLMVPNPSAWVQIFAVSQEQTKNTMKLFPQLLPPETRLRFGVQVGRFNVWALGDSVQIEASTSSVESVEGNRPSLVIRNEALALGTPLPTPSGWTDVASVQEGDTLLGTEGAVSVTHVTEVYEGRPCFKVTFQDGTTLVADEGHLWETYVNASTVKPRVRTTREMFEDGRSFAVPLISETFDSQDVDLPIDPYVLGYWLGDGDSREATLAVGDEDYLWVDSEMKRRGLHTHRVEGSSAGQAARISLRVPGARRNRNDKRTVLGLYARLKGLGLLSNKHVPEVYLRTSASQRMDLLRGLMDSDGCIASDNRAIFVNKNKALVDAVTELARSFGYMVTVGSSVDTRFKNPSTIYRVTFRVDARMNPFLMPRKASRVAGSRRPRKTIRSIVPVESVPVKCIEVNSEDHLFVAGRGWTLTHNTQNWKSSNRGHELAGAIDGNIAKAEKDRPSRMLDICNAYREGEDSVAQRVREGWEETQETVENGVVVGAKRADFGLLYDSLEAPPDAPLTADAVPEVVRDIRGDSVWLDASGTVLKSVLNPTNSPSESRRKWFNQVQADEDAWTTAQIWDALEDRETAVEEGEQVALFLDASKSDDATVLVGARILDGHRFVLGLWQKPAGKRGEGWTVPIFEVDEAVRSAFRNYQVLGFFGDPSHVLEDETMNRMWDPLFDEWHRDLRGSLQVWAKAGKDGHSVMFDMALLEVQKRFVEHLQITTQEMKDKRFTHDGDARMRRHVLAAKNMPTRAGMSIGKSHRESAKKIDLAVGMVGAGLVRRLVLNKRDTKKRGGRIW